MTGRTASGMGRLRVEATVSLTTRILLLVLLALAPALAIQGYNEVALRASRDEAVRADTMSTARIVADNIAQVADSVRQALDFVAQDPSVRAMDPAGCTAYLRGVVERNPHLAILALSRPDGTIVCNSMGSPPGAYTNAGRAYHRRAAAGGNLRHGHLREGHRLGEGLRPLRPAPAQRRGPDPRHAGRGRRSRVARPAPAARPSVA